MLARGFPHQPVDTGASMTLARRTERLSRFAFKGSPRAGSRVRRRVRDIGGRRGVISVHQGLPKTGPEHAGPCTTSARKDHSLTTPSATPELDGEFVEVLWCRPRQFLGPARAKGTRFRGRWLIDRTMARTDHSCSTGTRNGRRYPWSAPAFVMSCESRHHTGSGSSARMSLGRRLCATSRWRNSRFRHHGAHP